MSEILCPLCNVQSPEHALYCQQCGQPLRCKDCGTAILPAARACISCGKLIPERSSNEQFQSGINVVPLGYNRFKLHETPDVRDLDLIIHNDAIEHIRDFFPPLVGNRPTGRVHSSVDHRTQQQTDLVEVATDITPAQPQIPAVSSRSTSSNDGIWEIFRKQDGGTLKQDIQKLKASSKKDYLTRLVYLFLYAKLLLNEDVVPRAEIYTILDNVGLKDGNTAGIISQDTGISNDTHEALRLNYEGRQQAQQYIADVFNHDLTDAWLPGAETRSTTNRTKKSSKKGNDQHIDVEADIAKWLSDEMTKSLVNAIEHSTVNNLPRLDKALLALYGIYKAGTEQEVSLATITQYLYGVFQVQVEAQALTTAFYKARREKNSKASFFNFIDGRGYKITPSGRNYIEESLNLKQFKIAKAEVNVDSKGGDSHENNIESA